MDNAAPTGEPMTKNEKKAASAKPGAASGPRTGNKKK
eukprot:CAMPEP_0179464170 /NCGR_PEP_ID=MMETSP0799-20121207/46066_1 /TAXON_ID=46947 /ORGANISM="Geminigera cryophila, Strain CCMP2564" /LENGTH=36 /DNA_ID= /DNA_START= /DNA_END= /DNA_ORIENTATION=